MNAAAPGSLARLEKRIGHRFADRSLAERALTHSSTAGARPADTYERLEFLGDRVLGLVVADMLLAAFPEAPEGELARRFNALVRKEACAEVAREVDLGPAIRLGSGEAQSGGRDKPVILGDACEALIGALYLDGGIDVARGFIETEWRPLMERGGGPARDAKSMLQEWAQGRGMPAPLYEVVERHGPEHAPHFVVAATVAGLPPATGAGRAKREAEQCAAAALLSREGVLGEAAGE